MSASEVKNVVQKALPGARVEVRDDTYKHLQHNTDVGHDGGHYVVKVVWKGFEGMVRQARHRLVFKLFEAPWEGKKIHSLSLRLMTEDEAKGVV